MSEAMSPFIQTWTLMHKQTTVTWVYFLLHTNKLQRQRYCIQTNYSNLRYCICCIQTKLLLHMLHTNKLQKQTTETEILHTNKTIKLEHTFCLLNLSILLPIKLEHTFCCIQTNYSSYYSIPGETFCKLFAWTCRLFSLVVCVFITSVNIPRSYAVKEYHSL